ncbi:MAG: hypothetical protein L0213_13625, partial [Candidatus Dadabacteria bacterium]|nr:hypothetical protein [Candidatus Dadabacteria bacterium]
IYLIAVLEEESLGGAVVGIGDGAVGGGTAGEGIDVQFLLLLVHRQLVFPGVGGDGELAGVILRPAPGGDSAASFAPAAPGAAGAKEGEGYG